MVSSCTTYVILCTWWDLNNNVLDSSYHNFNSLTVKHHSYLFIDKIVHSNTTSYVLNLLCGIHLMAHVDWQARYIASTIHVHLYLCVYGGQVSTGEGLSAFRCLRWVNFFNLQFLEHGMLRILRRSHFPPLIPTSISTSSAWLRWETGSGLVQDPPSSSSMLRHTVVR